MRKWVLLLGLSLGLILPAFGGVAMAAGRGSGTTHASAHAKGHTLAGGQPAQPGTGGAFGQAVSQAVYAALSAGERGTTLANAVHIVIGTYKPNAKGISVAEAVYQAVYGASTGSQDISVPFKDMGDAAWASPSVNALTQAGVVRGTSQTTFSPNAMVTGAQLLTMLDRLQNWQGSGGTSESTVEDTSLLTQAPAFALQAIRLAISHGLVQGIGGLSNPNRPLTRAQAITLLINSLGLQQAAQSDSTTSLGLSGPVPSWADGAMALAIQLGLVQGSNGQILAGQTLTRAQMAVLLARVAMLETVAVQSAAGVQ